MSRSFLLLDGLSPDGHHAEMTSSRRPRNLFFPLAALCSVAFIVTILALLANVLGNGDSPSARWLDRHAGVILAGEVAAVLLTGFMAMYVDRRQTLNSKKDSAQVPHDPQSSG